MSIYIALLFVVLTPGVLLSLPPNNSKLIVVLTHAIIFVVVYELTKNMVFNLITKDEEGFAYPNFSTAWKNCSKKCVGYRQGYSVCLNAKNGPCKGVSRY